MKEINLNIIVTIVNINVYIINTYSRIKNRFSERILILRNMLCTRNINLKWRYRNVENRRTDNYKRQLCNKIPMVALFLLEINYISLKFHYSLWFLIHEWLNLNFMGKPLYRKIQFFQTYCDFLKNYTWKRSQIRSQ